ncbi:MAG: molybdopterin-dependent oxidoreductase [Anaerolineales bacterium]|nr:molybdopterin-dependent oxidoreductase [Anaerolineales bacterium]
MSASKDLNRREFLKSFATGGAGLLVGIYLSGCGDSPTLTPTVATSPTATDEPTAEPTETPRPTPNPEATFEAGIFIQVDGRGMVTGYIPRTELGQGTLTSLAMIIAEEMDQPLDQVQIVHSSLDPANGDLRTGGSDSISSYFTRLSKTASIARATLVTAAARLWDVPYESCSTESGQVIHEETGNWFTYAELVETAAEIPVSDVVSYAETKDAENYQIIGTPVADLDSQAMVDGSTIYGSDITLPGMLYAALAFPPVLRGRVAGFVASMALEVPGVRQVFAIDSGVAVVAENTWAALQGQRALEVTWEPGDNALLSSSSVREEFLGSLETFPDTSAAEDSQILEAVYEVPFYTHAPLEPMNCVADVTSSRCEVWAPTQNPGQALSRISYLTGLPRANIQFHIPRVGGGFGRRLQVDYVEQAVQISSQAGAPVKLLWTREQDTQHGFFHPLSVHHASVNLGELGLPRISSQTFQSWDDLTYAWRSVTNFTDAFVRECFLDEMAFALGRDPYDLRIELLPSSLHSVLEVAARNGSWGDPLPPGWGRGIACWSTWNVTPVAQVAEVSVSADGSVQVQRVVCAIDCGLVVNPDMVIAQMEGGIVWGLTAALKGAIDIENGAVVQSNFDDYPLLQLHEMPQVEVHLVSRDRQPTGVGEMGVPPAAPAVLNAIFAATGKRIRHLPVRPEDLL